MGGRAGRGAADKGEELGGPGWPRGKQFRKALALPGGAVRPRKHPEEFNEGGGVGGGGDEVGSGRDPPEKEERVFSKRSIPAPQYRNYGRLQEKTKF